MRFSSLLLAFSLLFIACGQAQTKTPEAKTDALDFEKNLAIPSEDAILYRIEGKKVKKVSYIYGTMHMISADKFYFPKEFKALIKNQDQYVMELSSLGDQMSILPKLMLPADQKLSDFFTPEQYDSLKVYFAKNLAVDETTFETMFAKMKPFMVMQTMVALPFASKKIESQDKTIYSIAEEKNAEVHGLETIDQQLGFFDNLPQENMAKMIMSSMVDVDTSTLMDRMENAYFAQSLSQIQQVMEGGESFIDEEVLINNRNAAWVPQIKKLMKKKSCFIAVGAGHLYGEKGVLELLKKEGYTITGLKMIAKNEE